MLQSWLLRCSLLFALATKECWANELHDGERRTVNIDGVRGLQDDEYTAWKRIEHIVVERATEVEALLLERMPDFTTSPRERAAPAIGTPRPTAPPEKRQDDGQIEALSSQLQSLSESATQALSSVSSSASSMSSMLSQSAESQLSQTQSSASSAMSQVSAEASSQLSRSMSSASSRLSSATSSASSAVSAAQVAASAFAASQVQEAQLQASGVQGNANNLVAQVRSNSVSATNVAIILSVAVAGTALVSTIISCVIFRVRRKKRRAREGEAAAVPDSYEEKKPSEDKPIAVRGTLSSPVRFSPFAGGPGSPMGKFKLPALSPILRNKKQAEEEPQNFIGCAKSDYTNDLNNNVSSNNASNNNNEPKSPPPTRPDDNGDVYGVSPKSFRLQKPVEVQRATSVRLIRVGSDKSKNSGSNGKDRPARAKGKGRAQNREEDEQPLVDDDDDDDSPPVPARSPRRVPLGPQSPPPTSPLPPIPDSNPASRQQQQQQQQQQKQQPPPRTPTSRRPVPSKAQQQQQESAPVVTAPPPAKAMGRSTMNSLRFRDSSEVESAEPTPVPANPNRMTGMRNTNTAGLRTNTAPSRPKNAGASFATFPKVRKAATDGENPPAGQESGMGALAARLRREADRRRREAEELSRAGEGGGDVTRVRDSGEMFKQNRAANWPLVKGKR
ncbi:hypothetical protein F4780DRAFT_217463 [Xylariomycetidae sp. FL0641]|nr:hypothetical protein F4780DRAFT_217463 [Xylariomycetidae sp. FL0641]